MRKLLLPVLLSGTFVQLVSVTVMQVAVPDIRQDLGAGPGVGQLVLAGYTLTYACIMITAARWGDRWGHRRLFVAGMAVFTLAAVIGAAAPTAGVLVGARLLQGLGSGLMAPQILSIIRTAVPAENRFRALAAFGATMAVASLAGPLLGGVVLQLDPFGWGWRLTLLLTVPVGLAALGLSFVLPPGAARPGSDTRTDLIGAGLSITGLTLLVLPLTVGQDAGWPAWTWASLVAAVLLLAAFAGSQRRVAHPLVHPSALAGWATRWGIAAVLVFNAGVPSLTLLLSVHLQGPLHRGPLQAALAITPFAVGALLGSALAERLTRRVDALALVVSAAGLGLMAVLIPAVIDAVGPALAAVLGVGGIGFGVFTAAVFATVLSSVDERVVSSVAGLLPTAQQLGGTLGVALAGAQYASRPDDPGTGLWLAMAYHCAIFLLATAATVGLYRSGRRSVVEVGRTR